MSDIFLFEVYKNINAPATAVDLLFSLILLFPVLWNESSCFSLQSSSISNIELLWEAALGA